MKSNLDRLREINDQAKAIGAKVDLLKSLSWPAELESDLLAAFEGTGSFPVITYPQVNYLSEAKELEKLASSFSCDSPIEIFTRKTILSYAFEARMASMAADPALTDLSSETFGVPDTAIEGAGTTNAGAAERLVKICTQFNHPFVKEPDLCVSAQTVSAGLTKEISSFFQGDGPKVEVVPNMVAKATASRERIKLRDGTCFNRYDEGQLLVHEVMTHALTAINGSHQPVLTLLGRESARTTKTQEGLATFSEVISGKSDLKRLLRIALRVITIDRALKGASIQETYDFFRKNGHRPKESLWSTARVFRGTKDFSKPIVFTKDAVYLDGLIRVALLFQWAFRNNCIDLTHLLFCGRLTIEDCFSLRSFLNDGTIVQPKYLPSWYTDVEQLAANLIVNQFYMGVYREELDSYFGKLYGEK